MKNVFFSLLLFCLGSVSISAPFAPVFLEREISGGFVPLEKAGWATKVSVHTNGDVISGYKTNAQSPWQYKTVAVLTVDSISKLQSAVSTLVSGELTIPDEPKCTDAPSVTYSAVKSGEKIVFAKETDCVLGYLESFVHGYELESILDGFAVLGHLETSTR